MTRPPSDGFASNEVIREAMSGAPRVHLLGLVSDGGVHSGFTHLAALIALAGKLGVPELVVHAFTDGRDTLPALRRRLPGAGGAVARY